MNTESDRHHPSGTAANRRRAALKAICQQHGVAIHSSFGSRARETLAWLDDPDAVLAPGPSDVDLGVKPLQAKEFNRNTEVAVEKTLEDLLGLERVVLVNLQCADPFLVFEVIQGERLYAESEYAADNYDQYHGASGRSHVLEGSERAPAFRNPQVTSTSHPRSVMVECLPALDPGQPTQDR